MNIQDKIDHIRRQPEHIRMRYVLGSVFVSMCFIGMLWIFSITVSFRNQSTPSLPSMAGIADQGRSAPQPSPTETKSQPTAAAPSLNEWIKQ